MKKALHVFGAWVFSICATVALSACATVGMETDSAATKLYAAHGTYNIALARAVTYAESNYADPGTVKAMNDVNKQVEPALRYSQAFIACTNSGKTTVDPVLVIADIKCGDFNFTPSTVTANANLLSKAAGSLLAYIKGKLH